MEDDPALALAGRLNANEALLANLYAQLLLQEGSPMDAGIKMRYASFTDWDFPRRNSDDIPAEDLAVIQRYAFQHLECFWASVERLLRRSK